MSILAQERFAAALLDRASGTPDGLTCWTGAVPAKRFNVYRNNVAAGLAEALAKRFPATEAIVGKEFFAGLARAYAMADPPRSPLLLAYGEAFPGFIESYPPAAELPYLADVARLENARVTAYHAPDVDPIDPTLLAGFDGERLADLKLALHPSFAVVRSAYPIVTIWSMNAGEMELAPIRDWSGEDALVVRPRRIVLTRKLPAGGAAFLMALAAGKTLGSAVELATADSSTFDLTANLAGLLGSSVIVAVGN
jgi:hypothetical protein